MSKASDKRRASPVERADIAVAEVFVSVRDHPLVEAAGKVSEIGDQPPLYAIAGGVIAAGLATGDGRTLRTGARILGAHALATMLKSLVKLGVDRTRPHLIASQGRYRLRKGQRYEGNYNSFPSGHTASSVAVARALGREYPGAQAPALGVASAVAATQVVRSTHYVTDLLAGAAIGLAAEAMVDLAFRKLHPDVA